MTEVETLTPEALAAPQVQQLLGRSALYEALSLALAYPTEESVEETLILVEDLVEHPFASALGITERLQALITIGRNADDPIDADRLAPVHVTLFDGSVLCSPHETEYIRDPLAKAAQLADIAGFYGAFGLQVGESHPTMPDFVGTELEFMALLTRREAYARTQGWDERALICVDAGRTFLETHLGRWVGAFAADLGTQAPVAGEVREDDASGAWFGAVATLLRSALEAEMVRENVWPSLLSARYADDDASDEIACPMDTTINPDEIDVDGPRSIPLLWNNDGPTG